jgi:tetratricopeptide (TPR) repeat protein
MATVYLADDLKHRRRVAIKVLRPEFAAVLGPERFLREIEITAKLVHPHILPLHDSGEADGFLYFVMPYVEGQTLREKTAEEGQLRVPEATRILRDIVDALAHAHSHGVVHRDIKPENVMLSERHALVADFGVARAVSEATGRDQLATAGVAFGTPTYMAPEQASAPKHIDHRADIYAVGVVAYELLVGRPPFVGTESQQVLAAHMTETPAPVTDHHPAVPPALATLVMRCLAKRPQDRWQTAEELLEQLEAFATPSRGVTLAGNIPLRGIARARRRPLMWAAVGAAVIAIGALGAWALFRGGGPDLVRNRVVVAPFVNRTGDGSLDHLGPMAADWVQRGLFETAELQVTGTPASIPPDSAAALQSFAREAGARLVVAGVYYRLRDSLRFEARITDAGTGRLLGALEPVAAAMVDPIPAIETLRQRIMSGVAGVTDPSVDSLARIPARPPSYAAYREMIASNEAHSRADWESAKEHAHRAWRLDSTYLPALVRVAVEHVNLDRLSLADSVLRIVEASRERLQAFDIIGLDRLRAMLGGDPYAGLRASERQAQRDPSWGNLTQVANDNLRLNRPRAALAILENLNRPRAGGQVYFWTILSSAHHRLGNYQEALTATREGLTRHRSHGWLLTHEMLNLAALGAVEEMRNRLDDISRQADEGEWNVGQALVWAGLALRRHGRGSEGLEVLSQAIRWFEEQSALEQLASDPWAPVWAFWGAGRAEEAAEFVKSRPSFPRNPLDSLGWLGLLAAARGDRVEALRLSERISGLSYSRGPSWGFEWVRLDWQAAIAAHLGDLDVAFQRLGHTHERWGFMDWQHVNPFFAPLHGYPPYEELWRPRG